MSSLSDLELARLNDARLNLDLELRPLSMSCFADANSISYNLINSLFWDSLFILFFSLSSNSLLSRSKSFLALFNSSFLFSMDILINSSPSETLSPLLNVISIMLPVVSDFTSIFLLWIVWPCNTIDWSIWLNLNSLTSTLLLLSSVEISFVLISSVPTDTSVASSWALTFLNCPEPIQPTTRSNINEAIKIDFFISNIWWYIINNLQITISFV